MGSEVVVIAEVVGSLVSMILLWAKEKGLSDAECETMILDALIKIKATKPENLPDV